MPNHPAKTVFLAFAALVAFQTSALPQDAKSPLRYDSAPPETVVVTGERPPKETLRTIVWNYVYAHGRYSPKVDQLTRWATPVCPEVRNLPAGYGDFIVKRIKAIAANVGAPTKENCKLNIEIIFTAQPQAIMDHIAENDPILLGYHFVHQAADAAKVNEPIQAWYVTATGNVMETYIDSPYRGTPSGALGSKLSHGLRSVFNHILILANTDKIAGQAIGPVADYIAMLALSQAQAPDNCGELPSILDLMSPDCTGASRPQSLSVADKAFLDGLYSMDFQEIGSLQRSYIAEHMTQDFKGQ